MDFHFISGMPRAGSTLLASILAQNPQFWAHIESPTGRMFSALHQAMGPDNEAHPFLSDSQRARALRAIFQSYYVEGPRIIFDNNRRWTANISLLATIFPACKVFCCVRAPGAVADSLETLLHRQPLDVARTVGRSNLTVTQHVKEYMAPEGVIGYALDALRTAFYGPERNRLVLIRYDDLARFPKAIMEHIHHILDVPWFDYRFDKIKNLPGTVEFDRALGMPGLHDLRPYVGYTSRASILPPELLHALNGQAFWDIKEPETKSE